MQPITLGMLRHKAQLMSAALDAYGLEELVPVANLSRVDITMRTTETGYRGMLIYDARNSQPQGVVFEPGQWVVYGGQRYRVAEVRPLYDRGRLHHAEITLQS